MEVLRFYNASVKGYFSLQYYPYHLTFSGAGGLDIGAIYARAQIIWANDMKEACESYALNIGEHIHQGDINSFIPLLAEFENIDLVIGSPPCQGFSVAGKMDENDERSKLIW